MAYTDAPEDRSLYSFESIPTSNSPCTTCKPALDEKDYYLRVSLESLQSSAESGCQDCRLQYLGVLQALGTRDTTANISVFFNGRFMRIKKYWQSSHCSDANLTVYLYTEKHQRESAWPLVHVKRTVGPRRTTYLAALRDWLKICRETHSACRQNENVKLPTRVLDVGSSNLDCIKLSKPPDSTGRYLALSHCWGDKLATQTTRDNHDAYKENICFSVLPKNFQDAVTVTRDLGLRYLWIDALCIIQDDKEEWEKESGNMASIYRNAYLVLGADMAKNSHCGFLENKNHRRDVPTAKVIDEDTTILARSQYSHHGNPCSVFYSTRSVGSEEEPLLTRAWTLQEQMVASRMAHFASEDLIWECDSALWCQCMELDEQACNARFRYREALVSCSGDKFRIWYDLVNNIGMRGITKPSDLLPALSGIAHQYQEHDAGPYLAGIWQIDLPRGLLWSTRYAELSFRASPYRAPSWSWASIQGENANYCGTLFNKAELQHVYAEIVDAECSAAGGDACGAVKGGWIEIRAPMFEIVYRKASWHRRKAKDTQPWMVEKFDFRFTPNQGDVLSCLFIGDVTMGPPDLRCMGLILRKRHDIPGCTFKRVGIFKTLPGTLHTFVDDVEKREVVKII